MSLKLKNRPPGVFSNYGYLLIEVLLTVAILGTVIVFIVRALSSSLYAVRRAAYYTQAIMLAEELDWEIKKEIFSGVAIAAESFPRRYDFSGERAAFEGEQRLFPTNIAGLSEMVSTVSWKDSRLSGQFSVSTYIPTLEGIEE